MGFSATDNVELSHQVQKIRDLKLDNNRKVASALGEIGLHMYIKYPLQEATAGEL
jgi:hypothetical protein